MTPAARPLYPMPADVEEALLGRGLMDAYLARPLWQRDDYIAWIVRANRVDAKKRRVETMLQELAAGDSYMSFPFRIP